MKLFLKKIYLGLAFAILALTPFFFWPRAQVVHEVPKVWLILGLIEIFTVATLLRILSGEKVNKLKNIQPIVFLLLASFLASIFGADFQKSLFGNHYRLDGLLTLAHLFAFSISFVLLAKKKDVNAVFFAIAVGSVGLSLWAVGDYILGTLFLKMNNPISITFGNPNFLGGYLAITTPIYFYFYQEYQKRFPKIVLLLLLLIQLIAVFLTQSNGAVLTLVFGILFYVSYRMGKKVLVSFAVTLAFALVFFLSVLLAKKSGVDLVYEGRQRIILKTISGVVATKRYLTGFGVANVDYAFDAGVWPVAVYDDVYLDKAHSTLLESFIATGVLGLASYLFLLIVVFKTLYIRSKEHSFYRTALVVFVMYVFHSQTNIISISEELIYWIIVATAITES